MHKRLIAGLAVALCLSASVAAAPKAGDLEAIAKRGEEIFLLDRAAWVATDVMLEQVRDAGSTGMGGWIVTKQPDGYRVIFYRLGDPPTAVFTADVRNGAVVASRRLAEGDDAALSPLEVRMVQAREVAGEQGSQRCTDGPMNTVVIPPATAEGPVEVYVLSAQVKGDEIPLGGHYRYDIGVDGKVLGSRRFTKGCLNMSLAPPEKGATSAGLMVTHLLDTTPTEIHVFTSFSARTPVYVAAPKTIDPISEDYAVWAVDGGSIRRVEP